ASHVDTDVEHAPISVAGHDGRAPPRPYRSSTNRGAYAGIPFFEEDTLCMRRRGGQGEGKEAEAECRSHRRFLQHGRHICTAGRALQALKWSWLSKSGPNSRPTAAERYGLRVASQPAKSFRGGSLTVDGRDSTVARA